MVLSCVVHYLCVGIQSQETQHDTDRGKQKVSSLLILFYRIIGYRVLHLCIDTEQLQFNVVFIILYCTRITDEGTVRESADREA